MSEMLQLLSIVIACGTGLILCMVFFITMLLVEE